MTLDFSIFFLSFHRVHASMHHTQSSAAKPCFVHRHCNMGRLLDYRNANSGEKWSPDPILATCTHYGPFIHLPVELGYCPALSRQKLWSMKHRLHLGLLVRPNEGQVSWIMPASSWFRTLGSHTGRNHSSVFCPFQSLIVNL